MQIDFSKISRRQVVWLVVAGVAGLIGVVVLFGNTGPKMMSGTEDGGAGPLDLLGAWGPIVAAIIALIKGVTARNPVEIVAALQALASQPKSQELIKRAEAAILDRLKEIHQDNPTVQNAISELAVKIAAVNYPPALAPGELLYRTAGVVKQMPLSNEVVTQ